MILRPRKARPFFGRHPWVLDSAIDRVDGAASDGGIVDLLAHNGKFVARGLYNSHSRIRVRLYTWDAGEAIDQNFWRRGSSGPSSCAAAWAMTAPTARRIIYSEADGLSGLIVDRYADYLVAQVTALGMQSRIDELLPLLAEATAARGIVVRADRTLARLEGLSTDEQRTWGQTPEGPVFIEEHGLRFGVELGLGQKTGFYLDQRDNRVAAAHYLRGARVLDLFCYTGGFSLAAAKLGAAEVLGIDSSEKAIALARAARS